MIYLDDCEGNADESNEFDSSQVRNFDDVMIQHPELQQSSLSTLSSKSSNSAQQAQEENLRQIIWEREVLLETLTLSKKGSGMWNTINLKLEVTHEELAGMLEDYVMSNSVKFSSDIETCDFNSMDQTLLLEGVQKYSTEWFLIYTAMKNLSCKVGRNNSSHSCSRGGKGLQDQTQDMSSLEILMHHHKSCNKSGLRRRYAGASLKTLENKLRNKRKLTILSNM
jgi:hypothetical protein